MKTRHFLMMAILAVGMAMIGMMMTSCAKEDNPVEELDGAIPGAGAPGGDSPNIAPINEDNPIEEPKAVTYDINVVNPQHGKMTLSHKEASVGKTIKITLEPDDGYMVKEVIVTNKSNDDNIDVTQKSNNEFTFTMPESTVKVKAYFEKIEGTDI